MLKQLFIIGLGGAIGSIFRYLLQIFIAGIFSVVFPLGTFVVNIFGCFLIGLFYGLAEKYLFLNADWRLFLITGLCGGFTTFSSFSYESLSLFKQGQYFYFGLYVSLSVLLGLFATLGGLVLIK